MDIAELEVYNPWWKTGRVREGLLKQYKRRLYGDVAKYIDKRQIVMLKGLRRVGKTTLLLQLIQRLIDEGIAPNSILYFSFDEKAYDFKEVLSEYQKLVLGATLENAGNVFLFLDEIQKVADWENKVKSVYDLYPNVKIFVSGSSSLKLGRGLTESLAGRAVEFIMDPLSFGEFLEMNGHDVEKIMENTNLWKREMVPLFYRYMKFGAFPELACEKDEDAARRYLLDSIIERVIYRDIPEEFGARDVELLRKIIYILGKNPGAIIDFREIGKNLGRDERTVSNYFEYLCHALIIRFVFNYRGSPVASMRKLKKVYFTSANLIFALNPSFDSVLPKALENVVASGLDARFFYRNGYEVDFINDERGVAVEVKTKGRRGVVAEGRSEGRSGVVTGVVADGRSEGRSEVVTKVVAEGRSEGRAGVRTGVVADGRSEGRKLRQIKKFMADFPSMQKGVIVDAEMDGESDGIKIIPIWKFLLLSEKDRDI
ncbi:MAG: hypothetical protein CVT48_00590 [Thermoplasmata archaeon HGW-Thermoplasmata-1]|nr:MAG: hypothetical protein CVT48_00590 [Thermoplasmata archaeon HGW-Thermoplasmata-1]